MTTEARGSSWWMRPSTASGLRRRSLLLATITGSTTRDLTPRLQVLGHSIDDGRIGEHAGLDGIRTDVRNDGVDLLGNEPGSTSKTARTPNVFWAVRAVTALMP